MVSEELRVAILKERARGKRLYELARAAGLHPSVMSALVNGIRPAPYGDPRIVAIGRVLGLDADSCFDPDDPPADKVRG